MSFIGPEGRRQLKLTARFAAAGVELVAAILIGYFGGLGLDRWLGTEPVCEYVGLVLGIITGFYNLFQLARRVSSSAPSSRSPDTPANGPEVDNEKNQVEP